MSTAQTTGESLIRRCAATNKKGEPCRSPVVTASGLCRVHDPAQAEAVAQMQQRGGRRKAETYQAALEAFMERNREKIITVYREALRANKIAIDQRTAEAVDTQQPDHVVRLQAAERIQDRVYGKPTARTEFTGKLELAALMADSPQAITDTDY